MTEFDDLLGHVKGHCWNTVSDQDLRRLAELSGPAEFDRLIAEFDALTKDRLKDDAGDLADEFYALRDALRRLFVYIGEPAVGALVGALDSPNPSTRGWVALALGQIRSARAVEPMIQRLTVERKHTPRLLLIVALGDLADARAKDVLLAQFRARGQNSAHIVDAAIKALERLNIDLPNRRMARARARMDAHKAEQQRKMDLVLRALDGQGGRTS